MNIIEKISRPIANFAILLSLLLPLQACESEIKHVGITQPLRIVKKSESPDTIQLSSANERPGRRDHLTSTDGPTPPAGRGSAEPILETTPPRLTGGPFDVNFEGVRLPAFINTVFGEMLKITFEIDNAVVQKDQAVTLRTGSPLKADEFFRLATEVLANYGVRVIYSNNVYRIVEATTAKKPIPRIIRSRSGATIPTDLRPVFFFQPISAIPSPTMTIWLNLVMADRVQTVPLPFANGLLLLGSSEDVRSASEIIQTLDQPYFAGTRSLKISPAFWSAQKLSSQLVDILTAEGYSVGISGGNANAIKLIPVEALNVIIVFGTGEEALQHVMQWAADLDQPSQTVSSQGAFYHQVFNAKAKDVADIIRGVIEGTAPQVAGTTTTDQKGVISATTTGGRQKITVDEARNGIIFMGTAEEYAQFRTLVQQMDRAPLQVMIEATIAEVTLKEGENLGVVFDFERGQADVLNRTSVKSSDAGVFLSLVRDHGTLVSQINALATVNRLQVLSSPRIVTSSGKQAAINVGTQVPIITSQETASGQVQGNTSILQSVQYRNTGVILNINPTINSARRVELTVSQEVSAAQENNLSGVQSPVIINRSLQTTLSLDDGETALLGGMISENYSKGNQGIPYLKDIPLIGNLFKTQSESVSRTELIILLTPYIIDGPDTAHQVRDAFRAKLGDWAEPTPGAASPKTAPAQPQH